MGEMASADTELFLIRRLYMDLLRGRCPICNWTPGPEDPVDEWTHCPNCLGGIHEKDADDCECGGSLEPVSIWVRDDSRWELIRRCRFCGELDTDPVQDRDNPIKLMSVAAKPLASPPFPIERMEEMTALMGGQGSTRGYYE